LLCARGFPKGGKTASVGPKRSLAIAEGVNRGSFENRHTGKQSAWTWGEGSNGCRLAENGLVLVVVIRHREREFTEMASVGQ